MLCGKSGEAGIPGEHLGVGDREQSGSRAGLMLVHSLSANLWAKLPSSFWGSLVLCEFYPFHQHSAHGEPLEIVRCWIQ